MKFTNRALIYRKAITMAQPSRLKTILHKIPKVKMEARYNTPYRL